MSDLINADLVRLDVDLGADKLEVIRGVAGVAADAGRTTDVDRLAEDTFARERTSATGLPGGVAIPHCRTSGVDAPLIAFARLATAVDFGASDGPADLVILLAAPTGRDESHLKVLTMLARSLVRPAFVDSLREAGSPAAAAALLAGAVGRV